MSSYEDFFDKNELVQFLMEIKALEELHYLLIGKYSMKQKDINKFFQDEKKKPAIYGSMIGDLQNRTEYLDLQSKIMPIVRLFVEGEKKTAEDGDESAEIREIFSDQATTLDGSLQALALYLSDNIKGMRKKDGFNQEIESMKAFLSKIYKFFSIIFKIDQNQQQIDEENSKLQSKIKEIEDSQKEEENGMPISETMTRFPLAIYPLEPVAGEFDKQTNTQCFCEQKPFEIGTMVRELDCGHCFHMNCIGKWLEKHVSCPICKQKFQKYSLDSGKCQSGVQ